MHYGCPTPRPPTPTKKQKQMSKKNEQIVDLRHQLLYKIVAYEKEKIARQKLRQTEYERWFEENYGKKRREAKDERNA